MSDAHIEPGWYEDPQNASVERWWGGSGWTDRNMRTVEATPPPMRPDLLPPPQGAPVYPAAPPAPLLTPPPIAAPPPAAAPIAAPLVASMPAGAVRPAGTGNAGSRSTLPWVVGGLIGVVVVLVGLIAFLLGSSGGDSSTDASGSDLTTRTTAPPTTTIPATVPATPVLTLPPPTTTTTRVTPTTRPAPQAAVASTGAPAPYPSSFEPDWVPSGGGGWVVQLASLPVADFDSSRVDTAVADLAATGISAVAIWSGDWRSLSEGYWVLVARTSVWSGEEAVDFCQGQGIFDRDHCFGNIVSQNSADSSIEMFP